MTISEKAQSMVGITPSHTDEELAKVRKEARSKATSKWFGMILDHHEKLEMLFAKVKSTNDVNTRTSAQKELAVFVTGHAIAEEAIIYPFMKIDTSAMDATHAYAEQALVKVEFVILDGIKDKMSQEYNDKLEQIRKAVAHHMVEEERDFFPELQDKADGTENTKISQHYQMEFDRYLGQEATA